MALLHGLRSHLHATSYRHNAGVVNCIRLLSTKADQLDILKKLRESSGAPVTQVKAALVESAWDAEAAYQILRKQGLAAVSKRASKVAADGLIGIHKESSSASIVEVNCETDFVARNDRFITLVQSAARAALSEEAPGSSSVETSSVVADCVAPASINHLEVMGAANSNNSLIDELGAAAASLRENIRVRRALRMSCPSGVISSYLHSSPVPMVGKIGALVALASKEASLSSEQTTKMQELGAKLAMHVVAAKPLYLQPDTVPAEALEAEKSILREQAAQTKKPPNVIEKMVIGRMSKFYAETCLLEQKLVMDESTTAKAAVRALSVQLGVDLHLAGFVRMQCGEGVEETQAEELPEAVQA